MIFIFVCAPTQLSGLSQLCHHVISGLTILELHTDLMWKCVFVFQWICTVNNISRQIYLTDNPEVKLLTLHKWNKKKQTRLGKRLGIFGFGVKFQDKLKMQHNFIR